MKPKTIYPLLFILLLAGCQNHMVTRNQKKPVISDDWTLPYESWTYDYVSPWRLGINIEYYSILDTSGNMSEPESPYMLKDEASQGHWNDKIKTSSAIEYKRNQPPRFIIICWSSPTERRIYETMIEFSPSLWQEMKTPIPHTVSAEKEYYYKQRVNHEYYHNTLLIGLAPGGKVRIWLQTATGDPNIPVIPKKITTYYGEQLRACKFVQKYYDYREEMGDDLFDSQMGYDELGKPYPNSTVKFIQGKTFPFGEW